MVKEIQTNGGKRLTKSDFTCIVSVYLDKEYKYVSFEDISKRSKKNVVHHEFDDMVLADEYCKTLNEMNNEFLGKFFYKVTYQKIEVSQNFTKIISLQPNSILL